MCKYHKVEKFKELPLKKIFIIAILSLIFTSCKKTATTAVDIEETAQQIGDVMASVDENGGSTGNIAGLEKSIYKTFAKNSPSDIHNNNVLTSLILPKAEAVSCLLGSAGFGTCNTSLRTKVRTFSNCSIGLVTLNGDVTFTWDNTGTNCSLGTSATNGTITRDPDFTVTGRRGATLTVTKTGTFGQMVTVTNLTPLTFSFSNDGINRKFTSPGSDVLFDYTSTTTSNITVTGGTRSGRVMTGGTLRVTNNLSSVTCDFSPTNVTWGSANCNCPTQGSWAGTCSDGKVTSLDITGCGTATYTEDTDEQDVVFDRCDGT